MKMLIGLWLGLTLSSFAQERLAEYPWETAPKTSRPLAGEILTVDGRRALRIFNSDAASFQTELLRIEKTPISKNVYAIQGEIRYEQVQGDGYLEMWSYFPPKQTGGMENPYFSRTLAMGGEMGKITGTSGWRQFILPFDRTGTTDAPTRLVVNLILPGRGTVFIGPIQLMEYAGGLGSATSQGTWWSERQAGFIGGIGGGGIGCLGSLLAMLAARGLARRFVLCALKTLIVLGGGLVLMGMGAIILRQPLMVWLLLFLIGGILLGILPFRLREYQKRYEEIELRRMTALDSAKG